MAFKTAVKRDANLRLALCGSAGSGKTFTSLALATHLGGKIAYVDTEHGSASKYTHTDTCGGLESCQDESHFNFDVVEPSSFDPRDLIKFMDEAIAGGYRTICIDSLSHYWMGPKGELDLVDATAKRDKRGNSFAAWKSVTPIHNALVDKILSAPIHVIVSMRTKTEWVIEKDDEGKSVPRKIGLAPIMRDGIEFEFDVCGDLDQDNNLTVTKSRCSALSGKVINRPGKNMAGSLREWLSGAPAEALKVQPAQAPAPASVQSSKDPVLQALLDRLGTQDQNTEVLYEMERTAADKLGEDGLAEAWRLTVTANRYQALSYEQLTEKMFVTRKMVEGLYAAIQEGAK